VSVAPGPLQARPNVGERVRQLQAQAQLEADTHTRELLGGMSALAALAAEVADGGDVYRVGARNMALQLSVQLKSQVETLASIMGRPRG
jgi:hypothetical protein